MARRSELADARAREQSRIDADPESGAARLQRLLRMRDTSNQSLREIIATLGPTDFSISDRELTEVSPSAVLHGAAATDSCPC